MTLRQSVLATLRYFDLADFPLTAVEVYRYLWQPPAQSFETFLTELSTLVTEGVVAQSAGWYFLPGRAAIIDSRQRAVVAVDQKIKRATQAVRFIKAVPFLKAVLVCNSVGREVATPESDIDVLIIAEKKRLWIVRFWTNLTLRLLGLRTYGHREADRLCLSFYIDTEHLDLAPLRVADDDVHFAYWLHQMVPVFDPENYYQKFLLANKWTATWLPNRTTISLPVGQLGVIGRVWKRFWEIVWGGTYGALIEKQAYGLQWQKMSMTLKEKAKQSDNGVVVGDGVVKLHEADARRAYREKWLAQTTL